MDEQGAGEEYILGMGHCAEIGGCRVIAEDDDDGWISIRVGEIEKRKKQAHSSAQYFNAHFFFFGKQVFFFS